MVNCKKFFFLFFFFSSLNLLQSFIPQNVEKVFVLNFSGTNNIGVRFSNILKKCLEQEGIFLLAKDSVSQNLEFYYPFLLRSPWNHNKISQLGELIDAEGIIAGHVVNCDIKENIFSDGQGNLRIKTAIFLNFYYEFYSAQRGDLLEKKNFSLSKKIKKTTIVLHSQSEKMLLQTSFMREGVKKMIEHIKTSRIDLSKTPEPKLKMRLAGHSKKWKKYPFSLKFLKMYSGLIAPEKENRFFDKGSVLWVNTCLIHLPQTQNGELCFEGHAIILDQEGRIVLRCPKMVNRHSFFSVEEQSSFCPLTLRLQLPKFLKKGVYFLKITFVEKVLYSTIHRVLRFQIR